MVDYFCFPVFFAFKYAPFKKYFDEIDKNNCQEFSSLVYFYMTFILNVFYSEYLVSQYGEKEGQIEAALRVNVFKTYMKRVIEFALKCQRCILYNVETEKFIDPKGNPISIKNRTIHFVSYIPFDSYFRKKVEKNGGIPLVSSDEYEKILHWYKYFPLDREIREVSFADLKNNASYYLNDMGENGELFIKTIVKSVSGLYHYDNNSFYNVDGRILDNHLKDSSTLLISKPLTLSVDAHDPREWRSFVMKGQMQNISRRSDTYFLPTPTYVTEFMKEQIRIANKCLPDSYVIDVMEYMRNGRSELTVAEFNNISSSVPFCNNTNFPILTKKRG